VLSTYALLIDFAVTLLAAAAVFAAWVANRKRIAAETVGRAEEQAHRITKDAERDADTRKKETLLEAKEKAHEVLVEAERQARQDRQQSAALEQTLARRDSALVDRETSVDRLEKDLAARERAVSDREKGSLAAAAKYERLVADQQRELERVAGLTAEEAKELLVKHMEADARHDAANLLKRLDAEARETAADRAKHYITEAIQRSAAEHAVETTVSVVDLPSDDLKGRIIGREGRNIRALELATGVDLIVDDTPGAIILSGFDPYRREIAKQSIERLIADGRIHPARIEEVVEKVKTEMEESVRKDGEAAAFELGMHDLHPELQKLMGRLKYRTSYGQNVLNHSKEVAYLAGIMAKEIGLNAHVAVRAAFLHDCGKAIDRELQGTHLEIGIDLLRKHSVAVVLVESGKHPLIPDVTSDFVYARLQGTSEKEKTGYSAKALDTWAKRARQWEAGGAPDDLKTIGGKAPAKAKRDVFIYMISGAKVRAPAAAMALIERLSKSS